MIWVYGIITALVSAIAGVLLWHGNLTLTHIGTSVLALFSTFLGATLAFRLNEKKEKEAIARKQREALNRALFVLIRQENAIALLKKWMDPYTDKFLLAFNMPASKPPNYTDLIQDMSSLEFLIESTNPNILFKLAIEQERFHQTLESLRLRNEFYVSEVQRAVAEKGLTGQHVTAEQVEDLFGVRVFHSAMNYAVMARDHVLKSADSLPELRAELRALCKKLFPKRKFLDFETSFPKQE